MKGEYGKIIRNVWRLLVITWEEDKVLLAAYFSTSFLGAVLLYVVYYVYKLMIDQVAAEITMGGLSSVLFIIVSTFLFFEYLSRFVNFTFNQYYFDYLIRAKLQNALTRRFMNKLAELDFGLLERGDVRNLIAKVEGSYSYRLPEILKTLNAIVYNLAALLFSMLIALRLNPGYFVILALVSAPIYYLRSKYGNAAWSQYSKNASETNYIWYLRSLFTNFQTLAEMKIYGLRQYFIDRASSFQKKVLSDYQRPIRTYTLLSSLSFILIPLAIFFAVLNFIGAVRTERYSIGDFTFFLNTLFTFSGQISSVLLNFGLVTENSLFLHDYFKLQDIHNQIAAPRPAVRLEGLRPREIVFENVSFSYQGSRNLSLKNVNVVIEKGRNVAIVGHNGAGKSTFIKLLLRFYDPTEGRILIDGKDLRRIDLREWYAHIGILFQDFARYFTTLRENIRFGNLHRPPNGGISEALHKSEGEDLLEFLPNKYDQILGRWFEHGVELSGGQWQKVAIARAIYRNAPILIMDEPTSAIDAEAEHAIFNNLDSLYRDKSLLFISHRFSTVRKADRIFVFEKGQVVEKGSHLELLRQNRLYAHIFRLQSRGYE